MQDSQIIAVKINNISAELELSQHTIKCITGETVHFEISYENLRSFLHVRANKILLNFIQNDELFQTTITSKHCLNIIKYLEQKIIIQN